MRERMGKREMIAEQVADITDELAEMQDQAEQLSQARDMAYYLYCIYGEGYMEEYYPEYMCYVPEFQATHQEIMDF